MPREVSIYSFEMLFKPADLQQWEPRKQSRVPWTFVMPYL